MSNGFRSALAILCLVSAHQMTSMGSSQCPPSTYTSKDASEYSILYRYKSPVGDRGVLNSVTIGFLGAYGETQVALGALPLAVDAVNLDKELLPGRRLDFVAADIGTYLGGAGSPQSRIGALAISIMTQMRDDGTFAFIGPDGTCTTEALVAAAWNIPMISYKCTDQKVSDKKIYYTFARTLPPSNKVSKSVVALLKAFSWTTFVIVAGRGPSWGMHITHAIKDLADENDMVVTDIYEFKDYLPKKIKQMEDIIEQTYQRTRVYVFVGEHIALVDFVMCLQVRGLLEKGEYIVISVDDEIYDPKNKSNIVHRNYLDPYLSHGIHSIHGFRSVLKLTPSHPLNPRYEELCEEVKNLSSLPPFCVPFHNIISKSISVPIHAAHLYDAVMIYARALTEILKNGEDPRNGTAVITRMIDRSYRSVQGYDVYIDSNGDAEGNYSVVTLLDDEDVVGPLKMSIQPVGYFYYASNNSHLPEFKYYDDSRNIKWVGGRIPLAVPVCGFLGEMCSTDRWRITVTATAFVSIFLVAAVFVFKHYRYEQKLAGLLWKIDMRDVTIIPTADCSEKTSVIQVCRHSVLRSIVPELSPKRAYTRIGLYKGNIVAIKTIHKRSIDITRGIRKELKQVREVRHENIISFIGACVEAGNLCILTAYCARGSLEDVLANKDLHLDQMFVSSLVADIIKGMIYLHDSEIISHGNLRSSNCLVDSRWVLQITDFGLHEFKAGQDVPDGESAEMTRKLYRAPELLRANPTAPARGSQKGDVYSFGILLYEIVGRSGPWGEIGLTPQEIIESVKSGTGLRPDVGSLQAGVAPSVVSCLDSCWAEDPEQRPDFRFVRVKLKEMQAGLRPNIFDNMLAIMEKYAYNLEGLVQERTNQLTEEKKKTDALLNRMLPRSVAEALKRGDPVEAESFQCVTIYFSDIVGFTEISAVSTPLQVVDLLNDLYTCCDSIISHYDVYKVETIGDAYMVVSGLPLRNGDRHAGEIASMAIHLLSSIKRFQIRHMPGEQLKLRIGIHSGQCVAGVVGLKMPRYCLFGDTVNTASRMESSGEAFRIHISNSTYDLLAGLGGYMCKERGITQIKGKGEMLTYWLIGEDPAKRRARLQNVVQSSISSERLSETPDLLRRRPSGVEELLLPDIDNGNIATSSRLLRHLQATHPYSKHFSQEMLTARSMMSVTNNMGHRSAPVITFTDTDFV